MPIVGLGYRRNSCFHDIVKVRVASHDGQERNRRKSMCDINLRRKLSSTNGMVQILGFSGNSTDRPHASTVEVLSVVGPMAGSGTLVAVKAQYV